MSSSRVDLFGVDADEQHDLIYFRTAVNHYCLGRIGLQVSVVFRATFLVREADRKSVV